MSYINNQKVIYLHWKIENYRENLKKIKSLRRTYEHFPYLYLYDEQEESEYHNQYLTAGNALDAFVALYDGELIGISIGCPLLKSVGICSELFDKKLSKGRSYYFGDIIVAKNFWGNNIARTLYQQHLSYIEPYGYTDVLALLIERTDENQKKPLNFRYSNLWDFFNFKKTNCVINYQWNSAINGIIRKEKHSLRAYQRDMDSSTSKPRNQPPSWSCTEHWPLEIPDESEKSYK